MRRFIIFLLFLFSPSLLQGGEAKLTRAYEENLIQRVKSVFSFKEKKTSDLPPRCATPLFLELSSVWHKLSPQAKISLSKLQGRPYYYAPEFTYDTPAGFFKIHYVTEGDSAVFEPLVDTDQDGVPDYVNRCGDILDSVWTIEVDSLGYQTPPSDGTHGGDDRYDVYLLPLSPFLLGYTATEEFVAYPSATSFIVLRTDYYGGPEGPDQYDYVRATASHEFFHAIQMGYDALEAPYWMEMSAVWMEEICYDEINAHLPYLPFFYGYPWLSLKTFLYSFGPEPPPAESIYHPYASCVFPLFLAEKFGTDIIRRIWDACAGWPGPYLWDYYVDYVLGYMYGGRSLEEEFRQFTIWNYFTGFRADTINFFSEGSAFPLVAASQTHSSYPVDTSTTDHPPSNLACDYIRFVTGGSPGGLRIHFDGEDGGAWKVSVIGYRPGLSPLLEQFDLDSVGRGTFEIFDWQDYQEIVMIPAVAEVLEGAYWDTAVYSYSYSAEFDNQLTDVWEDAPHSVPSSFSLEQNYPNPFNAATRISFKLPRSSHSALVRTTLKVFNIRGECTRTLVDGDLPAGNHQISWDGRDNRGNSVSSGVYFYKLTAQGIEETRKMVMIK